MENLKYVTRITVVVKTLCILPIFFVVKSQDDYIWVAVFFLLQEQCSSGSWRLPGCV